MLVRLKRVWNRDKCNGMFLSTIAFLAFAMSFSVASLRANAPIHIVGADNVATSFPNFIELATAAGMNVEQCD